VPRSIAAGRRTGAAEAVRCGSDSAELALLELPLIEGEDCAQFRELALSGDRALIEVYLACID